MRMKGFGSVSCLVVISLALAAAVISGCAGIEPPNPVDVVKHPLGSDGVRVGMTKEEVESLWGKPDDIGTVEDKEKWGGPREVWMYRAQASLVPVDAGYLSRTRKLYFDGDNLTNISD